MTVQYIEEPLKNANTPSTSGILRIRIESGPGAKDGLYLGVSWAVGRADLRTHALRVIRRRLDSLHANAEISDSEQADSIRAMPMIVGGYYP